MKVAIYGRLVPKDTIPSVQELIDLLYKKNIRFIIFDEFFPHLETIITFNNQPLLFSRKENITQLEIDFILSLGGDGTILDTVSIVRDSNIPIVGINIGRLGFLATIGKEEIAYCLDALEKNTYTTEERTLLHLDSNIKLFEGNNFALNDVTIHKKDSSSMITIHVFINGEFMMSYWADGLIISTPTGSTGYSLSCGGPIIFPSSGNFLITPVAPHNLNIRPIVVSDESVIAIEVEGRSEHFLVSVDSRSETINSSVQLAVRKEKFTVALLRLHETNFLDTLRNKLGLGVDKRN